MCLAHEYVFQSSKRGKTNKRGTSKSEVKTTENAIVVDRSTPTEFISLQYDINMGRLLMLNGDYRTAQTFLERAVQKDILVRLKRLLSIEWHYYDSVLFVYRIPML